jgi:outer membrane protein OmpA-like peptidoglycan-associated protein
MDAGAKAAAEAEVAALSETGAWTVQIALPSARTLCQIRVTAFSTQNSILFQSGSATIAESSGPALDTIASVLAECPDATVNVEGHTDADGDDRRNLALSVARAEAVIEALIQRGIAPERLYALGYGETVPIAPNESAEGKRLNRRIVFTLLEDEEAES